MIAIPDEVNVIGLSRRQLEVIDGLSNGKPAKAIAGELKLTINMVNNDIQRAIHSLHAGNAAGLVGTALRKGWIA
jgi:DNA-binding NarL/FixJ family response regulator